MKIEFAKSGGPGGQNVNKRETAVRIVHIPSGISVHASNERSQEQNRESAMAILRAKIFKKAEEEFQGFPVRRYAREAGWLFFAAGMIEIKDGLHDARMIPDDERALRAFADVLN